MSYKAPSNNVSFTNLWHSTVLDWQKIIKNYKKKERNFINHFFMKSEMKLFWCTDMIFCKDLRRNSCLFVTLTPLLSCLHFQDRFY
jgi:hypothetical protein